MAALLCASSALGFAPGLQLSPSGVSAASVARSRPAVLQLDEEPPLSFEEPEDELPESAPDSPSKFDIRNMPGISAPLGLFDPVGFSKDATEGKIKFYREVELKHSRIAMLAALGFPIGEQFHPLFGGEVDVPSYIAFQVREATFIAAAAAAAKFCAR